MQNDDFTNHSDLIRAAGGLVWRDESRRELAVVHRLRYDDWCLPKGKLDPGEGFEVGAVREVLEETGLQVRVLGAAGDLHYEVDGRPKIVRWFDMVAIPGEFAPSDTEEVAQVEWWALERARAELTYESERGLLTADS
ncbi:MAG: NUDIX hydrolase [Planctomycetota bacterium]